MRFIVIGTITMEYLLSDQKNLSLSGERKNVHNK